MSLRVVWQQIFIFVKSLIFAALVTITEGSGNRVREMLKEDFRKIPFAYQSIMTYQPYNNLLIYGDERAYRRQQRPFLHPGAYASPLSP